VKEYDSSRIQLRRQQNQCDIQFAREQVVSYLRDQEVSDRQSLTGSKPSEITVPGRQDELFQIFGPVNV
jgi:hypothetical protein